MSPGRRRLRDEDSLQDDDFDGVPVRKSSPEPRKAKPQNKVVLPKTITRAEASRLLAAPNVDAITGIRNRCILEMMYRAGLRVGEICSLKARDFDIDSGRIAIWRGKGGDGVAYLEENPETDRLMREWNRRRKRECGKSDLFFHTIEGKPVSPRYVQQMIQRMAKRAKIDTRVTPHMLRHSYATELLDEGVNVRRVQKLMRHKNLATTERYLELKDEDAYNASRKRNRPK